MKFLLFWIFVLPSVVFGLPKVEIPSQFQQGQLTKIVLEDSRPIPRFKVVFLRPSTEHTFQVVQGIPLISAIPAPDGAMTYAAVALVGTDVMAEVGSIVVRVEAEDDTLWAQSNSSIVPGGFVSETIKLNKTESQLREDENPKVVEQAKEIWRVYGSFDDKMAALPPGFGLPVAAMPRISGGFGDQRRYQYSDGQVSTDYHRGVDLAVPVGTPVIAPADGLIVFVDERILTGNTVVIEHGPGLYSIDFHLSRIVVKEGQRVVKGQLVAYSGATGFVTGPHLHWEIRSQGIPVDPLALVQSGLLDMASLSALSSPIQRKRG